MKESFWLNFEAWQRQVAGKKWFVVNGLTQEERKICLFKFTFQGGRTWAQYWEVANFLEWHVWGVKKGMNKSCFSHRVLERY